MTTRKRHTPEQVVRKLTQADRMLNGGKDVADVCRELQVSEQTYYRWRNQFGGMKPDDAQAAQGSGAGERHAQAAAGRCRAGEGRTQGDREGKLLSPERRRAAVHHLMRTLKVSGRFACRVTGQNRTTQRRPPAATTPTRMPGCARGCGTLWTNTPVNASAAWSTATSPVTTSPPSSTASPSTAVIRPCCGATTALNSPAPPWRNG